MLVFRLFRVSVFCRMSSFIWRPLAKDLLTSAHFGLIPGCSNVIRSFASRRQIKDDSFFETLNSLYLVIQENHPEYCPHPVNS